MFVLSSVIADIGNFQPVRPTRAFELGFDDTIPRAHRLDHLTISNVHADMPVVPDGKTGGFGDRVNRTGDSRGMIRRSVGGDWAFACCRCYAGGALRNLRIREAKY